MNKLGSKNLFYLSVVLALWFLFLYFNANVFHFKYTLIGVFQEIVTLPALVLQLLLCFVSFIRVFKEGFSFKKYASLAFLVLLVSNIYCLGSLVLS